jgi:hypothetical protein
MSIAGALKGIKIVFGLPSGRNRVTAVSTGVEAHAELPPP